MVEVRVPPPPDKGRRQRPRPFNILKVSADATVAMARESRSQDWARRRFARLSPTSFHKDGVIICVVAKVDPPRGFEGAWHALADDSNLDDFMLRNLDAMSQTAAILILGDPRVEAQVRRVRKLSNLINEVGQEGMAPTYWLPHSTFEDSRTYGAEDFNSDALYSKILESVDDMVHPELAGFQLATAVRSRMSVQAALTKQVNDAYNARLELNERVQFLQDATHSIVWDYLRLRLHTDIPALDWNQPPNLPRMVGPLHVATRNPLGAGKFGIVFALHTPGGGPSGKAVKCIEKSSITNIPGIKMVKHQIYVMNMLSKKRPHPHIVEFFEAHHTQTHILFVMENAGSTNLYRRLRARENLQTNQEGPMELPLFKVMMLISQITSAIDHMHSTCSCAHRDIKPENLCINETAEDITSKLIDFDVAIPVSPTQVCEHINGTFPFTAPEMHAESSYRPIPADIWSLGVLLCEVFCGVRVLERTLNIEDDMPQNREAVLNVIPQMVQHFQKQGAASQILETHALTELRSLEMPLRPMIDRMLCTDVDRRTSARQVVMDCQAAVLLQDVAGDSSGRVLGSSREADVSNTMS